MKTTLKACVIGAISLTGLTTALGDPEYLSHPREAYIPDFSDSSFHTGWTGGNPAVATSDVASSGDWDDGNSWNTLSVPGANSLVIIQDGDTITIDASGTSQVHTIVVEDGGKLLVDPPANTDITLKVVNVWIEEGGIFEISDGSGGDVPSDSTVTVSFRNGPFHPDDFQRWGCGVMCMGTFIVRGNSIDQPWTRAEENLDDGDDSIVVSDDDNHIFSDWKNGHEILIPESRQINFEAWLVDSASSFHTTTRHYERRIISSAPTDSYNGETSESSFDINADLEFDHPGVVEYSMDGTSSWTEYLPHVANLTRNVVFQSVLATETRGHVLFTKRADVDIRYATFRDLGRTKAGYHDTGIEGVGSSPHTIGKNQVGRYPLHFHHCLGPDREDYISSEWTGASSSYLEGDPPVIFKPDTANAQFIVKGCFVDGGAERDLYGGANLWDVDKWDWTDSGGVNDTLDELPQRWGIVLHGSSYGLVEDNIIYNVGGAGIVLEDGNEAFNNVTGNFICRIDKGFFNEVKAGEQNNDAVSLAKASNGTGVWMRGQNNWVTDNVATGCYASGFAINMYNWGSTPDIEDDAHRNKLNRFPAYPGDFDVTNKRFRARLQDMNDFSTTAPIVQGEPEFWLSTEKAVSAFTTPTLQHTLDVNIQEYNSEKVPQLTQMKIRGFERNEVYGACKSGFDFWEIGGRFNKLFDVPTSEIKDCVAWHFSDVGLLTYRVHRFDIDGLVLLGDESKVQSYPITGVDWDDAYPTREMVLKNSKIKGVRTGVPWQPLMAVPYSNTPRDKCDGSSTPTYSAAAIKHLRAVALDDLSRNEYESEIAEPYGAGVIRYDNCDFRCQQGIAINQEVARDLRGSHVAPRIVEITDCEFEYPSTTKSNKESFFVKMDYEHSFKRYYELGPIEGDLNVHTVTTSPSRSDTVEVTNWQGDTTDNDDYDFYLYYNQQTADYILPSSGTELLGVIDAVGVPQSQTYGWKDFHGSPEFNTTNASSDKPVGGESVSTGYSWKDIMGMVSKAAPTTTEEGTLQIFSDRATNTIFDPADADDLAVYVYVDTNNSGKWAATVTWYTNEAASTEAKISSSLGSCDVDTEVDNSSNIGPEYKHEIEFDNLNAATEYIIEVESDFSISTTDARAVIGTVCFTTPSNSPSTVTITHTTRAEAESSLCGSPPCVNLATRDNILNDSIWVGEVPPNCGALSADASAMIRWETNVPATSKVEYRVSGTSPNPIPSAGPNDYYSISHYVQLDDLNLNTTYEYRIVSENQSGISYDPSSSTWNTLTTPEAEAIATRPGLGGDTIVELLDKIGRDGDQEAVTELRRRVESMREE